jgi:hypothetical protein
LNNQFNISFFIPIMGHIFINKPILPEKDNNIM